MAAAGYGVLRDLLDHRGKYGLEELLNAGVYQCAIEYASGLVTQEQLDVIYNLDTISQNIIINIGDDIRDGNLSSLDEMTKRVEIGDIWRKKHEEDLRKISNSLKHADRDPDGVITLKQVDNIDLLFHAATAFFILKREWTNEMRVIGFLQRASMINKFGYPGNKIEEHLAGLTESQRLEAAKKLLDIFRAEG